MKIIRHGLTRKREEIVLYDSELQHGLISIELGKVRYHIQDKEGDLYINMTHLAGIDQLIIEPNASNAVTLKGI